MNSIGNMRVGTRLGIGFGIVMLTLLGVAAVGYTNATSAISLSRAMSENNRETVALSDAQSATWALRWGMAQFFAVTDASVRKRIVEDEAKFRTAFENGIRVYQSTPRTEGETAVLKEVNDAFGRYIRARAKVFELYGSGNTDEALKFRAEHLSPEGRATDTAFTKLVDLQKKSVEAQAQAMAETMSQGRTLLVWLAGIGMILAGLIGSSIIRYLLRQLGGEPAYAAEIANKVAAGDLSVIVAIKANDTTSLLAGLKTMNASLHRIVGEVRSGTDSISTASRQIAADNADLSQRTDQQASSLEATASTMEELTSTVKQNAENAKQANQLAAGASEVAVKGGQVVGQVVQTMSSINESSKKIVEIISVIDGIAFQTNILALNAAVEAARAGEQGRGFAVVATEVRTLAQRSAAAAKEIKELISDSVHKVEGGTKLVDEAGKTMDEIVAAVKRVTDIMAEISAASQEQSSSIEQVNQAVTQMDEATQQNAALVEEAAAAAESMEQQAHNLTQAVSVFKLAQNEERVVVRAERPLANQPRAEVRQFARAKAKLQAPAKVAERNAPARAKTGTDGEWTEF